MPKKTIPLEIVKNNLHVSDYNHTLAAYTNQDFRVQYQNSKGEYELEELEELKNDLQARLEFVMEQYLAIKSKRLKDNMAKRKAEKIS